jgi:hypothetical protein|tara:strand:- start:750 stop:1079 length:330 start_codon:yes stop_codon:yes gene_type:complete
MVQIIDQTAIFSQENQEMSAFLEVLSPLLEAHLSLHIIVTLSEETLKETIDMSRFTEWATTFKKAAKSFILVTNAISYEEAPEDLSVVPTIQEAKDVIEMEEIERDLGF